MVGITFEVTQTAADEFVVAATTRFGDLPWAKIFRLSAAGNGTATLVDVEVPLYSLLRRAHVNSTIAAGVARNLENNGLLDRVEKHVAKSWVAECERYVDQHGPGTGLN